MARTKAQARTAPKAQKNGAAKPDKVDAAIVRAAEEETEHRAVYMAGFQEGRRSLLVELDLGAEHCGAIILRDGSSFVIVPDIGFHVSVDVPMQALDPLTSVQTVTAKSVSLVRDSEEPLAVCRVTADYLGQPDADRIGH